MVWTYDLTREADNYIIAKIEQLPMVIDSH